MRLHDGIDDLTLVCGVRSYADSIYSGIYRTLHGGFRSLARSTVNERQIKPVRRKALSYGLSDPRSTD